MLSITSLPHSILFFIPATERKRGLLWHGRSPVLWEISVLLKKLRFEYMPREVRRQQNMEPQYFCIFFPSAFFYFLILSETATGLNMTIAVLIMNTYSYLQGFVWCYNDITQCGHCCSFTDIFWFNSCLTGAFHCCHTYSTQKQLLQTQNALPISFGRSNMWMLTAKWAKLSPWQSYVPSWAWIHPQINPCPQLLELL